MPNTPARPPPDREATLAEWLRQILEEGHKAQAVTLRWRKHNRALSEAAYAAWVRELKRRLRAGPPQGRTVPAAADEASRPAPAAGGEEPGWRARHRWPDWLADRLDAAWGPRMPAIAAALDMDAPLFVRVNTCRTDARALRAGLQAEGIGARIVAPDCLRLEESGRGRIFRSTAFREGLCEVQDLHSQQIVPQLELQPGQRVIDACAGEGGKTLQLACLMRNRGRLLALDTDPRKLALLRRRARRAGLHNIEARESPAGPAARRLRASADAVLVDAPCSGAGVVRRHPEIKWRLNPEGLAELTALQARLLGQCAFWAKPGGRVLYATCSLLPEEGEHITAAFLRAHAGEFTLLREHRWWPAATTGDAFYAALLLRAAT